MQIRRLHKSDAPLAAHVHRASFDDRLPWLAGLHTPEEDRAYYADIVFNACELWGAFEDDRLKGFIAFREGWIDQLYILPTNQQRGYGTALLEIAKAHSATLQLWTFQRNAAARHFYESAGFVIVEETDGADNEENEPDIRYVWQAA